MGRLSRRTLLQSSAASLAVAQLPLSRTHGRALAGDVPVDLAQATETTAAGYVLARLKQHGARALFGVPGATCDPLFATAEATRHELVVTSSDLEAAYAADGYARMAGLGAVAVTYGPGTLSMVTVIAGAYAERSPVVVVNGGPSAEDLRVQRELGSLFSHSMGRDQTDLNVFKEVTAYAARADDAAKVPEVVDTAIRTALTERRPVYIEIAKHVWDAKVRAPSPLELAGAPPSGDEARLAQEIVAQLKGAARPALLLGVEVQRYGLANEIGALVAQLGVPWTTTLLGKSVLSEETAGFAGVYGGTRALTNVKRLVEDSDALLMIGCVTGRQHRDLLTKGTKRTLQVAAGGVRLGGRATTRASLGAMVAELTARARSDWPTDAARTKRTHELSVAGASFAERRARVTLAKASGAHAGEAGVGYDDVMQRVSDALDESFVVLTDTSLSSYPAAELQVRGANSFVCNSVWQAIGFSVGAAVGVALGDAQKRRPLVVCGDGGFQMTATSLSTMAQRRVPAIVIVLDNATYGIEQWLLEPKFFDDVARAPRPYLALNRWKYAELARALGVDFARAVTTSDELASALADAKNQTGPAVIAVQMKRHDLPAALRSA